MNKIPYGMKTDQNLWYTRSMICIILIIIVVHHIPKETQGDNSIHIPSILLENNTYHGTIYFEKSTNKDSIIFLTSYQDLVSIPRSIIIPQGANQGIFEMQTLRSGTAVIAASIDGKTIYTNFTITSEYIDNFKLGTYTFSSLKADQIICLVYLLDVNNMPVSADRDIQLDITTTGSITTISDIYILTNHTHTVFEIDVDGDGEVFVSAKSVVPNSTRLEKLRDEIQISIYLAPNILAQGGHGYAIISIEKNGKPFISKVPTRVYLTSNNTDVIDLSRHILPSEQSVLITNGSKITDIYAKNEGVATIHAISPDIGITKAQVRVVESTHIDNSVQNNQIKLWAYPNVTADRASGIISLYSVNSDNDTAIPILNAEKSIFLASQGLLHKPIVKFSPTSLDRQSIIFDIKISSFGNHTLAATGTNLEEGKTSLTAMPILRDEYQFKIIQLPIKISNETQDLALVAITDETGSVIDAEINFGKFPSIDLTHSNGLVNAIITKYKNVAIISGIIQDEFRLTIFFTDIRSATKIIQPKYNPTNITLWIPAYTHVGEKFPFTIHKVNTDGTPIKIINDVKSWSATHKTRFVDGNFIADAEGMITITIHTDSGIATANTHASINQMSLDASFEDTVRVNKATSLRILVSTDNVVVNLDTDIPYEKVGEKLFVLYPEKIGMHDIIITAKKSGFVTQIFPIQLNVKNLAYLTLLAHDSQGNDLKVMINLSNMNNTIKTPINYSISTKTKFIFPSRHIENNLEYTFDKLVIDEKQTIRKPYLEIDSDTIIHAAYKKKLKIDITDGRIINDAVNYWHGDKIVIQPDEKSFILIHKSFVRWDGLPVGYDSKLPKQEIILQKNLDIKAIHDTDYTGIMIISGAIVTIIALKYLGYDIFGRIVILYHKLIFHIRIIHKNKGNVV